MLHSSILLRSYKVTFAIRQRTECSVGQEKPIRRGEEEGVACVMYVDYGMVGGANGRSPSLLYYLGVAIASG